MSMPTVLDDADGRKLKLAKVDPGEFMDVMAALGPVNSLNQAMMQYGLVICAVRAIDEVPLLMPSNYDGMKRNAVTLGEAGLAVARRFVIPTEEELKAELEAAKN